MSFVYQDNELLAELLKLAQTPAPVQPDATKYIEVAKQLVKNLQTELSREFNFTSERDNAELSQAHIVNVDELLNFLELNHIKGNGKSLVLNAKQFKDAAGKATDLVKSLGEAGKDYVQFPVQGNPEYYLYRDGLIAFLKDLEGKAANNPMLKSIVAKLQTNLASALPTPKVPNTDVAGHTTVPQVKPTPQVNYQQINKIISALPFRNKDIDFSRYEDFYKAVEPLVSYIPQTASHIAEARNAIQALNVTYLNYRVVPLGGTVNQFARMMKDQKEPGKYILPAIDALDVVLDRTRSIVEDFYSAYGANLDGGQSSGPQRALVVGQIGQNAQASSIYSGNAEDLAALRGTPSTTTTPAK